MPKLNRDGVNIYYEVHGSGPPLLLTHGYSSTSAMWQGQIAALSKQHKLILWDMRGHGQSDYPDDDAAYSEALTVADMAAVLDEVGAHSAIVGGDEDVRIRPHPDRGKARPPEGRPRRRRVGFGRFAPQVRFLRLVS